MIRSLVCCLLFILSGSLFAQKLDLIVTSKGDSIACKIDSIASDKIYLTAIYFSTSRESRKIGTSISTEEIGKYEYEVIYISRIDRIPGGIYFKEKIPKTSTGRYSFYSLERASEDELNVLLNNSIIRKTTGITLLVAGTTTIIGGALALPDSDIYTQVLLAVIVIPAGVLADIIGLPLSLSGASRVKRVNYFLNEKQNTNSLNLSLTSINNNGQHFCPGVKFTISF